MSVKKTTQQHFKKIWKHFLSQQIFQFIAGVDNNGDYLYFRISLRIFVKFEMPPLVY